MSSASTILLVRPARFAFNAETAASNHFQQLPPDLAGAAAQQQAQAEFDEAVARLRSRGLQVRVFDDTAEPPKPDAVFPNNWLTLHPDGRVLLYPMCAPNRRAERRPDILAALAREFVVSEVIDLSGHEQQGRFLEGTGSLVFDHAARVAYAALSPRTDAGLLQDVAAQLGYRAVAFRATDAQGQAIYHTNVMMCVGEGFAVLCRESIVDAAERAAVEAALRSGGHVVVPITLGQVARFAGNMLALRAADGRAVLVMSQSAYEVLTPMQRQTLETHAELLPLRIPTIETLGGGSARCMLAEVRLPMRPTAADQPVTLRRATAADIAGMHVVRVSVRENRLSRPDRVTEADYQDMLGRRGAGWVAEAAGRIVGFAIVDAAARSVWALFLHPDWEGRGIGRRLHDAMLSWCAAQGLPDLHLTTEPGTRAEHFYQVAGWQPQGLDASGEQRFERVLA
ncbi:citrulline utilization hydrolase CtlX [Hymenobacter sp. B81]|uniref:citrulline utilization hydrolase CtlX n=1 Tax=Hymenobacter sp. B81 TaxID=3344878 RepID=UPI0037DD5C4A